MPNITQQAEVEMPVFKNLFNIVRSLIMEEFFSCMSTRVTKRSWDEFSSFRQSSWIIYFDGLLLFFQTIKDIYKDDLI